MEDLSLHLLDVVENSITAGATRVEIEITEESRSDRLMLAIKDNGRGMPADMAAHVHDPFVTTRTTRRVGMGIPLLHQAAQEAGGECRVHSVPGHGTEIRADFRLSHIDRKPLGDLAATMTTLIAGNPRVDFGFLYERDGERIEFDTAEIKQQLDGVPIQSPAVLDLIAGLFKPSPRDDGGVGHGQTQD